MPGIDTNTKLLLHCDGADASTTFTDSSLTPKTVTSEGGVIDTAQSVFGGASGLFVRASSDYLTVPDHADWNFGTDPFTIDFRVRFASLPASGELYCICGQNAGSGALANLLLFNEGGTVKWYYTVRTAAEGIIIDVKPNATVSQDTWYHMALVRTGNDFMVFQDGIQVGATVTDTDGIPDYASLFYIGTDGGTAHFLNGWLEEFRVSKGIARWTTTFTPPTEAYNESLSSSSDENSGFYLV